MYDADSSQRARVAKDSFKVEALGAIDELNSYIGVVKSKCKSKELENILGQIQRNLLKIGSTIAGSKLRFSSVQTKRLEQLIDGLEGKLPVLKNFVIPGGTMVAARLQYARTLARRCERRIVALSKAEEVKPQILAYLNRLSDALFMLARRENYKEGIGDEIWVGKKK